MSRSLIDADCETLAVIVRRASARNASVGITGIVWFDGADFAQVLEGEHGPVGETIARIESDTRHTNIAIVLDREVRARAFGTWGMVRPDAGAESLASTAFLVGLAMIQHCGAARRLYDIVMACET